MIDLIQYNRTSANKKDAYIDICRIFNVIALVLRFILHVIYTGNVSHSSMCNVQKYSLFLRTQSSQ